MTALQKTAILALAALLAPPAAAFQQPPVVRVREVREAEVQRHDRVTGSLRAAHEAVLAALEEGALLEVGVREADRVAAGSVLARTDDRRLRAQQAELEAERARAEAELAQRGAELANLRIDLEALAAAAKKNAVSDQRLRSARTEVEVAEASRAAAESAVVSLRSRLELLRVRLADTTLRAPFDAWVVERHAEPGEWVRPGDPVVTLLSAGTLEAWLEVPERYALAAGAVAADAASGLVVDLEATGDERRAGAVRLVPRVDARARTFALVADLDSEAGRFVPGMSVSAWLPVTAAEPRLLVPKDALVRRPGLTAVFRVGGGEGAPVAEQVPVRVLFETGGEAAVVADLRAGERVVVQGNERLVGGSPVQVAGGAPQQETAWVDAQRRPR